MGVPQPITLAYFLSLKEAASEKKMRWMVSEEGHTMMTSDLHMHAHIRTHTYRVHPPRSHSIAPINPQLHPDKDAFAQGALQNHQ